MKYQSQKVAYWFFATCMLLLSLQLVYGFIMAFAHSGFDVLHPWVPFNVARAAHNNLLVMWLLAGFMGAAYYIIPDECERPLYWPKLAYVQLIALVVVGVTAIIGFHFGWWEGRKFLEIPRPLDYLVVVDVLLFVANIGMTVWKAPKMTTTSIVLFFGLLMAAVLYLPGMIPTDHQTHDAFWRWWVVHLWVEGVWELIMGGILAYLLIRLTGVDREIVEKWLYVIVGFTFLSGILGTGHHYYFIGTPNYWTPIVHLCWLNNSCWICPQEYPKISSVIMPSPNYWISPSFTPILIPTSSTSSYIRLSSIKSANWGARSFASR